MIFPNEKEKIIEVLGKQWSRKILPYLKSKKVKNAKGQFYSSKSIENIMNAKADNYDVEKNIIELVKEEQEKQKKLKAFKKQVLT